MAYVMEVKSKFDAEFRRFSFDPSQLVEFSAFYTLLERIHQLYTIPFVVQYIDPKNADLLPINNDKNFAVAVSVSKPLLRLLLQRKGESYGELYGYKASKSSRIHKSPASALRSYGDDKHRPPDSRISMQNDFHLVSSILDVDIVPRTMRRVRLVRTSGKHFGLYIRNGISHHHTVNGYESVPAFFVSRLDKDGIAYGTGLLAEDDEIIEVNGIEVFGKTMDQVTDMMVANSSNLIITVRPADQRTCLLPTDRPLYKNAYQSSPKSSTMPPSGGFQTDRGTTLVQLANGQARSRTVAAGSSSGGNERSRHRDADVNGRNCVPGHGILVDEDETDDDVTAGLITL
ncbi:unnamed protein product [Calicophoron daubneyi]|uniref:Uncharacterized protein n=1 Tax=Calicophoron daubneyi TaxID=300641 RepID=A0AAV2TT97_CALDB